MKLVYQNFELPAEVKLQKIEKILTGVGVFLVLIGLVSFWQLWQYFDNRYLPGTTVDNVEISKLTPSEALVKLRQAQSTPSHTLKIISEKVQISSTSAQLKLFRDFDPALHQATTANQRHSWTRKAAIIMGWGASSDHATSNLAYDEDALAEMLAVLQNQVAVPAQPPVADLKTSGNLQSLTVFAGKTGQELDQDATTNKINQQLNTQEIPDILEIAAVTKITGQQLTPPEIAAAQARAEKLVGKNLRFTGNDQNLTLNDRAIIKLLTFPTGYSPTQIAAAVTTWKTAVTRQPQDAVFEYDSNSLQVKTFKPHRDGLQLDVSQTQTQITQAITQLENSDITTHEEKLALEIFKPKITLAQTNNLGINEIIGKGESEYDHSIPTRIHNVALTTERITNHIVRPGEEFSFNKTLGDVSSASGFKPAYVIKNGQTILGDGGGVCQVSTTLFRALLNGGLKITKRLPHSYRVSYYELNSKPGVDATVYAGNVDLRFVNDTSHAILVHAEADTENLYMKVELYGTSDGRKAQIVDHITWDARSAPAPVYTLDPSLPPGTKKQVDWAASGIKAKFKNVITDKNGAVIREDVYTSNYQPWSAKYLVGP